MSDSRGAEVQESSWFRQALWIVVYGTIYGIGLFLSPLNRYGYIREVWVVVGSLLVTAIILMAFAPPGQQYRTKWMDKNWGQLFFAGIVPLLVLMVLLPATSHMSWYPDHHPYGRVSLLALAGLEALATMGASSFIPFCNFYGRKPSG